jgi:predicted GIY-YIG superfamily endonuclease
LYYIYRFYNLDEIIYVGKTINLKQRFYQHSKKDWFKEVTNIDIAEVSKLFVDIYEQYYINYHRTKYNIKDINQKYKKFYYPLLHFNKYEGKGKW